MGPITGPAVSNYHVIFCTYLNTTFPKPILWSCVLIMHNSTTEFNNQRRFYCLVSLSFETTSQFALFQWLTEYNIKTNRGNWDKNLLFINHILKILLRERCQSERLSLKRRLCCPFLDYTVAKSFATPTKEDIASVSPHIHMLPLSAKLRGVWGWVQAWLTPSLCAPALRRRNHSDKHTHTDTQRCTLQWYWNTNTHLKAHIFFTCDAHLPFLCETHMHITPAYMGVSMCLRGFQVGLYHPRKYQTPAVFTENKPSRLTQRLETVAKCQTCAYINAIYIVWYGKCCSSGKNFIYQYTRSANQEIELWLMN